MDSESDQGSAASAGSAGGDDGGSIIDATKEGGGAGGEEKQDEVIVMKRPRKIETGRLWKEGWELPEGWAVHSVCRRVYDASIYEEYKGGKPGQPPSPVWAFCVVEKEGENPVPALHDNQQQQVPGEFQDPHGEARTVCGVQRGDWG